MTPKRSYETISFGTIERFNALLVKRDGHMLFLGYKNHKGYGRFWYSGRMVRAHQFAWMLSGRTLLPGEELHHNPECPKNCVDVDHLTAVTPFTHPDSASVINRQKTHCPKGHAYSEENTYLIPGGKGRMCRRCQTELHAKWQKDNKDHVNAYHNERNRKIRAKVTL